MAVVTLHLVPRLVPVNGRRKSNKSSKRRDLESRVPKTKMTAVWRRTKAGAFCREKSDHECVFVGGDFRLFWTWVFSCGGVFFLHFPQCDLSVHPTMEIENVEELLDYVFT